MSDSNKKQPPSQKPPSQKRTAPDLSDIDWDHALSEWEQKTFDPEIAKDRETDKAGSLTGASKPLYRPPPPAAGSPPRPAPPLPPRPPAVPPRPSQVGRPPVVAPRAPTPPPAPVLPAAHAAPPLPPPAPAESGPRPALHVRAPEAPISEPAVHDLVPGDDEEESGATVIAAIPRELLRGERESQTAGPRSTRGGLGQLFSRSGENPMARFDELEPAPPVKSPKGQTAVTSRPPPIEDDQPASSEEGEPSVVTSAKHMPRPGAKKIEPLRRPSQLDPGEAVPEGALFDPFAEPPRPMSPLPPPMPPTPASGAAEPDAEAMDDAAAAALLDDLETTLAREDNRSDAPRELPALTDETPAPRSGDALTDALTGGEDATPGPSLLAPAQRKYDPNEETFVVSKKQLAASLPAAAAGDINLVGAGDDADADEGDDDAGLDEATQLRERHARPAPLPSRTWEDERLAAAWLDDATRAGLESRATWLEEEARATSDKHGRARGLLAVSELHAILGAGERARELAAEARDLSPAILLAHRQARALGPKGDLVEALDLEARHAAAVLPARLHATLLAADSLRLSGDDEAATKRYDQAFRMASTDVRAPTARASRALARGEAQSAALRLPDAPELAKLSAAIGTVLRLRGEGRKDGGAGDGALPNDALRNARAALDKGDASQAAALLSELTSVPEASRGASWLAAALGATRADHRREAAGWVQRLAESGDDLARRSLAARAVELGDRALLTEALRSASTFTPAERASLTALVGGDLEATATDLDVLAANEATTPLGAALGAVTRIDGGEDREARARTRAGRVAGSDASRAEVTLARSLAAGAKAQEIEEIVGRMGTGAGAPGAARMIALEMAVRAERYGEVSDALAAWTADTQEAARDRKYAAALVAERSGDTARALAAFRAARDADGADEAAVRAIAALDPETDLAAALDTLADELGDGVRGAVARLEAYVRAEAAGKLDDAQKKEAIERAHRAAPQLPIAAFLAERMARRSGNLETVLKWIRERRAAAADPLEAALDGVREALLVADADHGLAVERLEEAHRARPADVALRELYERLAEGRPEGGAEWREQRAAQASGEAKELFYLEAAHEYERIGDKTSALRAAEAAAASAGDRGLARVVRERAELEAGQVARLADELLSFAKSTEDTAARRDAFERLAVLDAAGREDSASALLWHRSILEDSPHHLPSLRHVEQALVGDGRDEELEPIAAAIATALDGRGGGEASAHAELAARLRLRAGDWDSTRDMVELAARQKEPSLWALRMQLAHARGRGDEAAIIRAVEALLERVTRPQEVAALLVRAGEAASRKDDLPRARELLERAATEDPGDVVTWGQLADVRQRAGDARGAAEACESLARTSVVPEHQLLAWYDAGRIWLDEVKDDERGTIALEQAAAIDVTFQDTFERLKAAYTARRAQSELATLLERRSEKITDEGERITMEIERGRVLLEVGDPSGARNAFEAALAVRPDDPAALGLYAELCVAEREWDAAEQAWVRLARLLPTPDEQKKVYARLGELYATHAPNLSRAEVALKEVLKRAPNDLPTMERLVDVYRRQNDAARAVELQQELINRSGTQEEKRRRLVDLALIFESTGHDNRKAEQALEGARRAFPNDVHVLRALADFYQRHRQTPALNILLDRAAADARRAIGAGRVAASSFEIMQAVFELRGKKGAAETIGGTLAAIEARPSDVRGGDGRALDPALDEHLAPEILSTTLRALLAQTGDALDIAAPFDLRGYSPSSLPPSAAETGALIQRFAQPLGMGTVQVFTSARLRNRCIPVGSAPATILIGEGLASHPNEAARRFLLVRALKLVAARASALVRTQTAELVVLVSGWLAAFNPQWRPDGVDPAALAEIIRRVQASLPRNLGPDAGIMAMELSGALTGQAGAIGPSVIAWANHAALLAVGDLNVALDALAMSESDVPGAPSDAKDRAAWIAKNGEARDLIAFSASDGYAEARAKLGL